MTVRIKSIFQCVSLTMSKCSKYNKKYNKAWEKEDGLKEWILSVPGDEKIAACKFCKTTLRAYHTDLVNHSQTEKHKKNATPFSNMRTLLIFKRECQK